MKITLVRRKASGLACLVSGLILGIAAAPIAAQDIKRDTDVQRTQPGQVQRGVEASREQSPLFQGRDVTYEEVLAKPDDIELNFQYALTLIRKGDLLAASSTLERILLINPNQPRVRVVYAVVLFRLDNLDEAERELNSVLAYKMGDDLRAELDRYLTEVKRRKKQTRFSVLLSLGYQFDSNRNAAPGSGRIETAIGPILLDGVNARQSDHSLQNVIQFSVEHDLGHQARHRVFAWAGWYLGEQLDLRQSSVQQWDAAVGGVIDLAPFEIKTTGYWRRLRLSHEHYLSAYGVNVRADWRVRHELNLFGYGQAEAQQFQSIDESEAARLRTGPEYRGGLGFDLLPHPELRVTGMGSYIRKTAIGEFNRYDGAQVSLDGVWLVGWGMFLLGHASYEYNKYAHADVLVSDTKRRDHIVRTRVTYGVPLQLLLGSQPLPSTLDRTTLTAGYEYYRSLSNITNYQSTNHRVTAGVLTRFDF
ncbi:MAG: tetratricopeptide repeat protein [Alphaproteobacteria bacterium]